MTIGLMKVMSSNREASDEIFEFLQNVFEIYEVRGRVGNYKSIIFEIRSREDVRHEPHVHARCGEYQISINLVDFSCTGNLPKQKMKYAIDWVKNNQRKLLKDWVEITTIEIKSPFLKSLL